MSDLFENALQFAAVKHAGQVRKGTDIPYITHPVGVAFLLQGEDQREEVVAAGLLHDILEDTATSEEELLQLFGEEVLQLVKSASEPDKTLSWEERKGHTIADLAFRSNEELAVITADKLHNLQSIQRDIEKYGEDVWARFNRGKAQQAWYYREIVNALQGRKEEVALIRKFATIVAEVFGLKQL